MAIFSINGQRKQTRMEDGSYIQGMQKDDRPDKLPGWVEVDMGDYVLKLSWDEWYSRGVRSFWIEQLRLKRVLSITRA